MSDYESIKSQLSAYEAFTSVQYLWRPILMRAVLDVSSHSVVKAVMRSVDPAYDPSDSTVKRMLKAVRAEMGLPILPKSEARGRTPDAFYDPYRRDFCAAWIEKNGGLPRVEQLGDPAWDLKPYISPNREKGNRSTHPSENPNAGFLAKPEPLFRPTGEAASDPPISPPSLTDSREIDQALDVLLVTPQFPEEFLRLKCRQYFLAHGEEPELEQQRSWYPGIAREMADAGLDWSAPG